MLPRSRLQARALGYQATESANRENVLWHTSEEARAGTRGKVQKGANENASRKCSTGNAKPRVSGVLHRSHSLVATLGARWVPTSLAWSRSYDGFAELSVNIERPLKG